MPIHEFSIDTHNPYHNIVLDLIQQDFFQILNRCVTDRDQKFQLFNELMKIVLNDPIVFPLCLNWFDDLLTNNQNLTQLSDRIDRLKLEWVNHAKITQTQIDHNERLPHWSLQNLFSVHQDMTHNPFVFAFYFMDDSPINICLESNRNIIRIDLLDNTIEFITPYVIEWITMIKQIPSRHWNEVQKSWTIPLTSLPIFRKKMFEDPTYPLMVNLNIAFRYYCEVFEFYDNLIAIRTKITQHNTDINNNIDLEGNNESEKEKKGFHLLL